jgi:hypothetical protein
MIYPDRPPSPAPDPPPEDEAVPAIIFLDIDGVLNAHDFDRDAMSTIINQGMVGRLNYILKATGAKVVLSSAWRYIIHRGDATLAGMDWLLRSHGLMVDVVGDKITSRLISLTRPDTMMPPTYSGDREAWPVEDERGRQISDWLGEHGRPPAYLVIDDGGHYRHGPNKGKWTGLGIEEAGHPVLWTDSAVGLTVRDADRAVCRLMAQQNNHKPAVTALESTQ